MNASQIQVKVQTFNKRMLLELDKDIQTQANTLKAAQAAIVAAGNSIRAATDEQEAARKVAKNLSF